MSGTSAGRFQILIGTISRSFAAQLVSSYHISVLKLAGGKLPVSGQSMQKAQFEIRLLMCSALILITGNIIVPSLCIYDDCLLSGLWMHALVVKSFSQNLKIRGFVFPNACQAWIRSSSPWCKSAWKHTGSLGRPFRSWDIWMVFAWWEAISGARSPAGRILLDMLNSAQLSKPHVEEAPDGHVQPGSQVRQLKPDMASKHRINLPLLQ